MEAVYPNNTPTVSPARVLADAVVAVGRSGDADVHEHLAALSHIGEDNPLAFQRVWQLVHQADQQELGQR